MWVFISSQLFNLQTLRLHSGSWSPKLGDILSEFPGWVRVLMGVLETTNLQPSSDICRYCIRVLSFSLGTVLKWRTVTPRLVLALKEQILQCQQNEWKRLCEGMLSFAQWIKFWLEKLFNLQLNSIQLQLYSLNISLWTSPLCDFLKPSSYLHPHQRPSVFLARLLGERK